jgi:hypothetical protein
MLSLYKSEKFQNEVRSFRDRISKVDDLKLKTNLENQINKLESIVKSLDSQFEEMIYSKQIGSNSNDSRTKISDIRKFVDSKLLDFEKSKKLSIK